MFLLNKTADYVGRLSDTELTNLVTKVQAERGFRQKAKQHQKELFDKLVEKQKHKKLDTENKGLRALQQKEDLEQ